MENVDKTLELNTALSRQGDTVCALAQNILHGIDENPFLNAIYQTTKLEKQSQCQSDGTRR